MHEWFFLSERGLEGKRLHLAYGVNYEFEDLLVRMTGGSLLAPANTSSYVWANRLPKIGRVAGWAAGASLGRYQPITLPPRTGAQRILFITAMGSRSLRMLTAIRDWRKEFDLV